MPSDPSTACPPGDGSDRDPSYTRQSDDPRIRATVEGTARELAPPGSSTATSGPTTAPRRRGELRVCSFWLVDNLALAGHTDRAATLFERLLGHTNDLGLLAEEVDPASGQLPGNFPQAFSHVGLISAAINLQRGRQTHQTPLLSTAA